MSENDLRELRRAFARWRGSKQRSSEPVPEALWGRAVDAAREHGATRTAQQLGLNHSALKQRIECTPAVSRGFVELSPALFSAPETTLEIEDSSGVRLRVVLAGASPQDVVALARELWSSRS